MVKHSCCALPPCSWNSFRNGIINLQKLAVLLHSPGFRLYLLTFWKSFLKILPSMRNAWSISPYLYFVNMNPTVTFITAFQINISEHSYVIPQMSSIWLESDICFLHIMTTQIEGRRKWYRIMNCTQRIMADFTWERSSTHGPPSYKELG